jgi:hypothetical protein
VSEERHHHATDNTAAAALPRRVRSWLGLPTEPRVRRPRRVRLEPVHRTWIAACWQARAGVTAGVTLDDYLRSRLAHYLAMLPVPRARLPIAVDVDDGELVVKSVEAERRPAPPAAEPDAWLAPLVALEGPAVRQEAAELEVRLAVLDGEIDAARRRGEELSRRVAADVSSGLLVAPSGVEATAEQLGRPPVHGALPQLSLGAFAAAAFAAESWQVALPLLRAADVDPARLGAESARRPIETAFAALFAFGVSAALFGLAHVGLDGAISAARGEADRPRRRALAVAAGAATAIAALVAAALGAIEPRGARMPVATYVLLLLAVPLATALALRRARAATALREAEVAAALTWDRERARTLAERARRLEELDWADQEVRDLERQRDAARRRLREISARAMTAARVGVEAEHRERVALARLAQSLLGALELDRYEYVRQASVRGAPELVAPRRRKSADVRSPSLGESPTPAPGAMGVPVPSPAEGRLAS